MWDIVYHINRNNREYVFCGSVKIKDTVFYIGRHKIYESDLKKFIKYNETINISDIKLLLNWSPKDVCNAIDFDLERLDSNRLNITVSRIFKAIPDSIGNEEKNKLGRHICNVIGDADKISALLIYNSLSDNLIDEEKIEILKKIFDFFTVDNTTFDFVYRENSTMTEIIRNVNKVLSPYFMEPSNHKYRDIIYRTIYGFKLVIANKYNVDMDNIYKSLSFLEKIIDENEKNIDNNEEYLYYSYLSINEDSINTNNKYFSAIAINHTGNYSYEAIIIHQLLRLFSQQYIYDENGLIQKLGNCGLQNNNQCKYINEFIIEKITRAIIEKLKDEAKKNLVVSQVDYSSNVYMIAHKIDNRDNRAMKLISIMINSLFEDSLYMELFNHTGEFYHKLNNLQDSGDEKLITLIDYSLGQFLELNYARNFYLEFSKIVFQQIDKGHWNLINYLNLMNDINSKYACEPTHYSNILNPLFQSREIEYFYKTFYKEFNSKFDLLKEINPTTRSEYCTEFLIIIQSLKTINNGWNNKVNFDIDMLKNLAWNVTERDDYDITLAYKYDNVNLVVYAKKDYNYGFISIKNREITNEEDFKILSLVKKIKDKESKVIGNYNFSFIVNLSQKSDYSEVVIKNSTSAITKVIHSIAIGDIDTFNNNIEFINKKKPIDKNNNNLFHLCAYSFKSERIFEAIICAYGLDANEFLNSTNNEGNTSIDIAIENKDASFLEMICKYNLAVKNSNRYISNHIRQNNLTSKFLKKNDFDLALEHFKTYNDTTSSEKDK